MSCICEKNGIQGIRWNGREKRFAKIKEWMNPCCMIWDHKDQLAFFDNDELEVMTVKKRDWIVRDHGLYRSIKNKEWKNLAGVETRVIKVRWPRF